MIYCGVDKNATDQWMVYAENVINSDWCIVVEKFGMVAENLFAISCLSHRRLCGNDKR